MLTPKHRALFAAAYSAPLLRTGEEAELPPAVPVPDHSDTGNGGQAPGLPPTDQPVPPPQ